MKRPAIAVATVAALALTMGAAVAQAQPAGTPRQSATEPMHSQLRDMHTRMTTDVVELCDEMYGQLSAQMDRAMSQLHRSGLGQLPLMQGHQH